MDKQPVRGLILAYFHRFVDDHGGRDCFQGLTTLDVCLRFVKPYTATSQLSLVDHVLSQPRGHEYAKPAQWLISHSWSYQFLDVVDAIDGFCHEHELSPDTSLWFCMFANNQHTTGEPSVMFGHFLQAFRTALESTGKMMMVLSPWHDPETLKRTWCVYEVYLSIVLNARFEVAMGSTQKFEFMVDIKKPDSVLNMLSQINSSNSITTVPSDRDLINSSSSTTKSGWILKTLDKQIDLAATAEDRFEWVFTKAMRLYEEEKIDEARHGFQLAVDIFKTNLPPSFWQGWEAQLFLGACSAKHHHARETWEPLCNEALLQLQTLTGRDHPALFHAKFEVGDACCWSGDFDRGMPLLVEALALAEEFHGAEEVLHTKHSLGLFLFVQGRLVEAEAMLRLAYDGLSQLNGPTHKTTAICGGNLSSCYVDQGRYREAEALMAWNFKELQRTLSEMHEDILTTRMNLGGVQRLMGNYDDAETNIQKSLEGYLPVDNQMYALHARRQLGLLKLCQGDLVEAKTRLEVVHNAFLETLAPTYPSCRNVVMERYLVSYELGSEFDLVRQIEAFQQLLEATNIDNDTWSQYCCHKCYKPIDGDLAICAQCPRHSMWFCKGCLSDPKMELVCGHNNDGPWNVIPHPTRYLRERKAMLLAQETVPEQQVQAKVESTKVPRAFLLLGTTIAAAVVVLVHHRREMSD